MSISACKHKLVCRLQGTPVIYITPLCHIYSNCTMFMHVQYVCHSRLRLIEALCDMCTPCIVQKVLLSNICTKYRTRFNYPNGQNNYFDDRSA